MLKPLFDAIKNFFVRKWQALVDKVKGKVQDATDKVNKG